MKKKIILAALAAAMLIPATSFAGKASVGHVVGVEGPVMAAANSPKARHWADSVLKTLTLQEQVAQLMCPKVATDQGQKSMQAVQRLVQKEGVGALLFTNGTAKEHAELINRAQQLAKVPVLITIDGEWGVAMRIKDVERFPVPMALGAITDLDLLHQYGVETARQCRAFGVQTDFSPVVDINSNPANPVIGRRSFGSDPQRVTSQALAYARGLEEGGVQAVAKHFPGHGDTGTDSHKTLPVINKSLKQLEECEFVPFRAFSDAGISGMMTGHMSVPAIDKKGTATSLTPKTYELLRKKIGFRGLIFTDALGMKGANSGKTSNALLALKAGADVMECEKASEDIAAIVAAVKSGKLSKKVVADRCRRVLQYKYALGLTAPYTVDAAAATALCNDAEAQAVNHRLSRALITCVYNNNDVLPLKGLDRRSIAVVTLGNAVSDDFGAYCRRYARCDVYNAPEGKITPKTMAEIKKHNTVIIGVYDNRMSKEARAAVKTAFARLSDLPGAIAVMFTTPMRAATLLGAHRPQALVMGYDDTPYISRYAAQALFGGIKVTGTLPAPIGSIAGVGTGVTLEKTRLGYTTPLADGRKAWLTDSIDSISNDLIARGGMPGARVLVAKGGNVIHDGIYGNLTKDGPRVNAQTMYDLASVSKALGTLPGVMLAVDKGYMEIDKPLSQYIPGLRIPGKDSITVREFLYHETGMPPAINLYTIMIDTATLEGHPMFADSASADYPTYVQKGLYGYKNGKLRTDILRTVRDAEYNRPIAKDLWGSAATTDTLMNIIYRQKLRPTRRYTYSCLNFCLLKDGEEHATGIPHQIWCDSLLWEPLGAWSICYRPSEQFPIDNIAPTEDDTYLRRQMLQGYVHDETAAFMGGVSGNAGLFANADDLAKICQMWLNGGEYGGERLMSQEVVKLFTTDKSPTCHRGLGFDKPNKEKPEWSSTCDEAGPQVFGHTGFTGTVFWVDPKNDIIFIFLTNRVNPIRDSPVFNRSYIRAELFRQTLNALAE